MKTYPTAQALREALVDLMKTHGIRQAEVCRKAGLAQSVVSLFMYGKRGLNYTSALKIQNFIVEYASTPDLSAHPPKAIEATDPPAAGAEGAA